MQFYELDERLVVADGDASAVWQWDAKAWKVSTRHLAVKAQFEGQRLTPDEAKRMFKDVDFDSVPDLDGTVENDTDESAVLDRIEAALEADT